MTEGECGSPGRLKAAYDVDLPRPRNREEGRAQNRSERAARGRRCRSPAPNQQVGDRNAKTNSGDTANGDDSIRGGCIGFQ